MDNNHAKGKKMGGKFTLAALTLLVVSCIGAVQAADFDDAANTKVIQDYAQKLQDTYVFPAGGKQLADKVQQDLDSVVADQHNDLVYVEFDALDEPPPPPKPAEPVPRPVPDNFGLAKFDMRGKTAYLQMTRFAPVDRYSTEALASHDASGRQRRNDHRPAPRPPKRMWHHYLTTQPFWKWPHEIVSWPLSLRVSKLVLFFQSRLEGPK